MKRGKRITKKQKEAWTILGTDFSKPHRLTKKWTVETVREFAIEHGIDVEDEFEIILTKAILDETSK